MPDPLSPDAYRALVREALLEDVGPGDITTRAVVPETLRADAIIQAKSACVVAGLDVVREVFRQIDTSVDVAAVKRDGDACVVGDVIAHVKGPAAAVLTGERTALNFLQHLSGIATATRAFVEAASGRLENPDAASGRLRILDTRKTIAGFRTLAKYAVTCGGGVNHRVGLYDGILIKDNHIRIAGGVEEAVRRARAIGSMLPIEVEAQRLTDVDAALVAGADIIMLDNMDDAMTRAAIAKIAGRAKVELSGNMTMDRVRALADSGADYISIGAVTHSAPAADISLEVERLLS